MSDGQRIQEGGPFNGPFDFQALLLDAAAAIDEGCWVDSRFIKNACIEVTENVVGGTVSSFSLQLLGSNSQQPPNNTATETIGGTVSVGGTISLSFTAPGLPAQMGQGQFGSPGLTQAVSYSPVAGDTTSNIATALAALVNAALNLTGLGLSASATGAVITLSWPGQQSLAVSSSVTGGSETVTYAVGSDGTNNGSAITQAGLTNLSILPRWSKARLTAISQSGAGSVSVAMQGNG